MGLPLPVPGLCTSGSHHAHQQLHEEVTIYYRFHPYHGVVVLLRQRATYQTEELGTARKIVLDRILGPGGNRCRDLMLAMIVGRILDPASKLAAARALSPATTTSSLGTVLGLGCVDEDELYTALDWLRERQPAIETALARRHLKNGTLVLYDVSSSYLEGHCCPLAQRGYSRDGRHGTLQIVYGLLCAPDGCPVAIEVFEGNTGDPMTLAPLLADLATLTRNTIVTAITTALPFSVLARPAPVHRRAYELPQLTL
jgi:hypothetical protein